VQANPNIMDMEMAKHFCLVASSLRNTVLTKDKMKEGGIKHRIPAA
jgi:hypothetical protein